MFTANFDYTFNDLLKVNEFHARNKGKKRRIIILILSLVYIGLGTWFLCGRSSSPILGGLLIFLGIYLALYLYIVSFLSYLSAKKKSLSVHYEFNDESFALVQKDKSGSTYYSAITMISRDETAVYFYIGDLGIHYIPNRALYGGTADEFYRFLCEKSAKRKEN